MANGNMDLTAVAKDAAGNTTTSAAVAVTVNNAAGPPARDTGATADRHLHADAAPSCHTGVGGGLPGSMNLTQRDRVARMHSST